MNADFIINSLENRLSEAISCIRIENDDEKVFITNNLLKGIITHNNRIPLELSKKIIILKYYIDLIHKHNQHLKALSTLNTY